MEVKSEQNGERVVGRYSRNRSIMSVTNNPLEAAAASADLNVEVLTDAVLISEDVFKDTILAPLEAAKDNEERLSKIEELKQPYLFNSSHLLSLCDLTTSLKTKLEFIKQIGPRLMDPTVNAFKFQDMFRFVEEKMQVEQVLKDRSSTLSKACLADTRRSSHILSSRGGRGGRGGSGRGGRPSLASSSDKDTPEKVNANEETSSSFPSLGTVPSTTTSVAGAGGAAVSSLIGNSTPRKSAMSSLFGFADDAQSGDTASEVDDLAQNVQTCSMNP